MAKKRVQLWGIRGAQNYATVEEKATIGATVGVDLRREDGSLVTEDDLGGGGSAASGGSTQQIFQTVWKLILEIPTIVKNLAALTSVGFVRHSGSGVLTAHDFTWVKNSVEAGESILVPAGRQLRSFRDFVLDGGDLTLDGELIIDSGADSENKWPWVKNSIDTGENLTIPVGRQVLVFRDFMLNGGNLTLDGELVIIE